jgi:hypothetical protein
LTSPFLASPPLVETKKIVPSSSQQPSRRLNFAPPFSHPWVNVPRVGDARELGIRLLDPDPLHRQPRAASLALAQVDLRRSGDLEHV